jgi:hypothetical protein
MRCASLLGTVRAGVVVPVAVAAVAGILAGAGPASAATRAAAAPGCTDTWVGGAPKVLWNVAQNWSTGKVPGPASAVCISDFVIVTATGPISIHSLRLGNQATVDFAGTASDPSRVTIAAALDNLGNVELDTSWLSAAQVDNSNGLESLGASVLTTPSLHNSGDVVALEGSLTLPDSFAQLSDGTLTGGMWEAADNGVLGLPGDITSLASGLVALGTGSAISTRAGGNALAGLASVGLHATLAVGGSLTLTGSLVCDGTLDIGSYDNSASMSVAGTLTQQHGAMAVVSQSTVKATTVRIEHTASLSADGTIDGNLVNDGALGPAYHLAVTGSYTQGPDATLAAGFVPELQVAGKATLAGTLITGTAAAPGTTSTAITFSSLTGGFTSHSAGFNLVTQAHQIDVVAQTQIAASPSSVTPGGTVNVSGGDFGFLATVTIYLNNPGGPVLGTKQLGDQGSFTAPVTVPASTLPGTHKIVAVDSDGRQAQTTITVT